jgi:ketosteroid isomerase-like protein
MMRKESIMTLIPFARSGLVAFVFLLALPALLQPQTFSNAEQEAWDRESHGWDLRTAGKVDQYMALWDDDFAGWPAGYPKPVVKADLRSGLVRELANTQPGSNTVKLEPLSVRIFGDVAAVFYRVRYGRIDNAGARTESLARVTHIWRRTAGTWKIFTGMSAVEPNQ